MELKAPAILTLAEDAWEHRTIVSVIGDSKKGLPNSVDLAAEFPGPVLSVCPVLLYQNSSN